MSTEITEIVKKAADRIESVEKSVEKNSKAIDGLYATVMDIEQKGNGYRGLPGGRPRDPLAAASDMKALEPLASREVKSVRIPMTATIAELRKSTFVFGSGDGNTSSESSGFDVQPQRLQTIGDDSRRRLSLLDVMPRVQVSSNAFEFNRLAGYSNAAGYQVNQGDLKSQASLPTELEQVRIQTIAHFIKASTQVLQDAASMPNFLNSLMLYGVLEKLEREIIAGSGTDSIAGLKAAGNYTVFTPSAGATNAADKIGEALASLDIAGWRGNAILLHPRAWQAMRAERATTGNEYLVGSWSSPAPPNVWGVPVITSAAVGENECFVLDTSQTLLLDRMSPLVEMGYVDDDFTRNLVTIRAELRASVAVISPSAVIYFELEEASSGP